MSTTAKVEAERMERLLERIEAHPLTAKVRADEAAATLEKRKAAAERIAALEREWAEARPAMQAEIDGLTEQLAHLDAERRELQTEIDRKRVTLAHERAGNEGRIGQQREILLGSYAREIDAAFEFFRDRLDELRRPGKISTNALGAERNIFTEIKTVKAETNANAVHAALTYCMEAVKTLEQMRLVPEVDLPRIEALKAEIPKIDVYEEVTAEKSLAREGAAFMSPMRYINDKIDRLLGRT